MNILQKLWLSLVLLVRLVIVDIYDFFGWLKPLVHRAVITEVGFSGYVSLIDEQIAKNQKLYPLNRFEKWILAPYIEEDKKRRREVFRMVVFEVTGEDINEM